VVGPEPPESRVVAVELVGGSVVLVEVLGSGVVVLVVVDVLVGGRVVVVVLVGGRVVVVIAEVVELARRVAGGITNRTGARVVGGTVTVAGEVCWRSRTVVAVLWVTASAACLGAVSMPTRLPPTAPSTTAATTLTHRRAATKRTGPTPDPPGRAPCTR